MTIGEIISEARRKRGKSIRDVEKATRISAKHIEAIENDNYDALSAQVYAKGFIRSIAIFLEVEPDALIRQFNMEFNSSKQAKAEEASNSYTPVNISPRSQTANKMVLILAGAIIGLIGLLWVFGLFLGTDDRSKPEQDMSSPAIATSTTISGAVASSNASVPPLPTEMKIKFTSVLEKGCWLLVEADGQKVFEDVVPNGAAQTFSAKKTLTVRVGNPEGVTVERDGKKLGVFDKDASGVTTRTYKITDKF